LKEGVDEVRQFMQDLRPTMLEAYGLEVTLEQYTAQFCARWGIAWTFQKSDEMPQLGPAQDIAMLRILQESLRNVRSHAGPDAAVSVFVEVNPREVQLKIADNGLGFDPLLVAPKISNGEGILGMRERASSVHGRFSVESRPGGGSIVSFALPIGDKPDTSQLGPTEPGQGGTT
jgi:signal transduction histidine kinase